MSCCRRLRAASEREAAYRLGNPFGPSRIIRNGPESGGTVFQRAKLRGERDDRPELFFVSRCIRVRMDRPHAVYSRTILWQS